MAPTRPPSWSAASDNLRGVLWTPERSVSAGRRAAGVGCGGVGHRKHVYEERKGGPMVSAKRILVLASAMAGDWPPLAAVTMGLHQAGHAVLCFGDPAIAQDFAAAG